MIAAVAQTNIQPDLERIIETYTTRLLRTAFIYLKDRYLAEDAVQETFLRVYKSYSKFQGLSSEQTWIYQITINICKDMLRSRKKTPVTDATALDLLQADDKMEDVETKSIVLEILKLPAKYKDVVVLFYYHDMNVRDISNVLHISESAVKTRLSRARDLLKPRLKGWL